MSDQHDSVWDARPINDQLREACTAVLHGVFWDGFNGPVGIDKDEALDYAVKLATWVKGVALEEPLGNRRERAMTVRGVMSVQLPCPACGLVIDLTAVDLDPTDYGGAIVRCDRCRRYLNFSYSVALKLPARDDGEAEPWR